MPVRIALRGRKVLVPTTVVYCPSGPQLRVENRGRSRDVEVRWIAVGLIVIGALLLFASLFADALGIGAAGSDFGWKQMIGTMLGAGLCLGGVRGWWALPRTRGRGTEREG